MILLRLNHILIISVRVPSITKVQRRRFTLQFRYSYDGPYDFIVWPSDTVTYDIRNNEVEGAVDNYFDVGLHYGNQLKIKLKTNHVVAKDYPRFIVHGTNGSFIKYGEDRQENDLKAGIMPESAGFGEDSPMYYGIAKYRNANGDWIEKQIKTPLGDYGRFYDAAYETIVNGAPKLVKDEEAVTNIEILENGFAAPSPSVYKLEALNLNE